MGAAGAEQAASRSALRPFSKLRQSSVEALRYRGEDIARSLTSKVVNEVRCSPKADGMPGPDPNRFTTVLHPLAGGIAHQHTGCMHPHRNSTQSGPRTKKHGSRDQQQHSVEIAFP